MNDLIDRQEAIDRFNVIRPADPKKDEYTKGIDVGIAMCIVAVKDQPTIQPEKAQHSQQGTTSDLISRTETVERLRGVIDVTVPITDYDGGYVDGVEVGISTVSTMPTIQPVATDICVGDTISRQQAIDALDCINGAEEVLRSLPSAQPEPSIPLSWIEEYIEWIKSVDNEFTSLEAAHISVMVKKWRDEQNETD